MNFLKSTIDKRPSTHYREHLERIAMYLCMHDLNKNDLDKESFDEIDMREYGKVKFCTDIYKMIISEYESHGFNCEQLNIENLRVDERKCVKKRGPITISVMDELEKKIHIKPIYTNIISKEGIMKSIRNAISKDIDEIFKIVKCFKSYGDLLLNEFHKEMDGWISSHQWIVKLYENVPEGISFKEIIPIHLREQFIKEMSTLAFREMYENGYYDSQFITFYVLDRININFTLFEKLKEYLNLDYDMSDLKNKYDEFMMDESNVQSIESLGILTKKRWNVAHKIFQSLR